MDHEASFLKRRAHGISIAILAVTGIFLSLLAPISVIPLFAKIIIAGILGLLVGFVNTAIIARYLPSLRKSLRLWWWAILGAIAIGAIIVKEGGQFVLMLAVLSVCMEITRIWFVRFYDPDAA